MTAITRLLYRSGDAQQHTDRLADIGRVVSLGRRGPSAAQGRSEAGTIPNRMETRPSADYVAGQDDEFGSRIGIAAGGRLLQVIDQAGENRGAGA